MKGLLFYDRDCGRGGPEGYLAHYQKWCVEIDGKKVHIHSDLTGSHGFPPERGGPTRDVAVKPCDGSCQELVEVDEWTTRKALEQIESTDRLLTPQEKTDLPAELGGATYLSELTAICRSLLKDRERERKEARAGYILYHSIKQHLLGRFFKNKLNGYKEVAQWE